MTTSDRSDDNWRLAEDSRLIEPERGRAANRMTYRSSKESYPGRPVECEVRVVRVLEDAAELRRQLGRMTVAGGLRIEDAGSSLGGRGIRALFLSVEKQSFDDGRTDAVSLRVAQRRGDAAGDCSRRIWQGEDGRVGGDNDEEGEWWKRRREGREGGERALSKEETKERPLA